MEAVRNGYAQMLEKQRALTEKYIIIEGLPKYPVDLTTKAGQKVIKDFIRRLVEELCEAHQSMYLANEAVSANQSKAAVDFLTNCNLEIADAWHFLLELLLFMGYENKIDGLIQGLFIKEKPGYANLVTDGNPLRSLLKIAGAENFRTGYKISGPANFSIVPQQIANPDQQFLGNKRISDEVLGIQSILLWNVTCYLNYMANELKNRDWSQRDMAAVNIIRFEENLFTALLAWFMYLDYGGFTEMGMFKYYCKKNEANWERINGGY